MENLEIVAALTAHKGSRFAGFRYKAVGTGEVSDLVVILGASTENLYEKDLEILQGMSFPEGSVEALALAELVASRLESLAKGVGHNSQYVHSAENADTYETIPGLPGIKVHRETGEIHVSGLVHSKRVIEAGEYKVVKSSPKTIAKNKIRKELPSARFRQYKLDNLKRVAANGEVLELETA